MARLYLAGGAHRKSDLASSKRIVGLLGGGVFAGDGRMRLGKGRIKIKIKI
jgi:hypothetical protein